jgi:hypothetical protein
LPRYSEINWDKANCKGAPTNLFYMVEENRKHSTWIDVGILRTICGGCPIQKKCLAYALEHEIYGVWGGMTTQERNAFNGKGSWERSKEIILELAKYGISITEIKEAVIEYQNHVRDLEN